MRRGEVWWGESPDERGRPFLILTRDRAIGVLGAVLVAPVTRTVRGIPTEVGLGPEEGMPAECAASLDNVRTMRKAMLTTRLGSLGPRMHELCAAVRAATDC